MINKKKLGAFVLAGTMLLSMGTTVFAAGEMVLCQDLVQVKMRFSSS